ncbi:unnamed protein product [Trichobilharzia regenti]|nr:unnamed protein product [Trichobilharzia regenti]
MCSGTYQSPIALSRASSVFSPELKTIQIYRSGSTKTQNQIVNSGHSTVQYIDDVLFYNVVLLGTLVGSRNRYATEGRA